ncbi:MAG: alanine racemase [Micromonosporaceae bacterium]|nr:alanine racemase [Micromonosporaceae bacterium]
MIPDRVAGALRAADRPVCAYVYDTAALRERATAVRSALPGSALLLYAVKANGHPAVAGTLACSVDGLEVASGGELAGALAAGTGLPDAVRIAFSGPGKTDAELAAAVAAGATINVESELELRRLAHVAGGRSARIALRVNRSSAALPGTHQMTGTATQFGIDEASLVEVAALAGELPGIELAGLHLHAVSNNLDAAAHARFVRDAMSWAAGTGLPLQELNVGGGFGVDYTGARRFDLAALRAGLAGLPAGGPRLVFEIGRYLAAAAGWYAAEVLDLKRTHGRWYAVLRGGTHHFRLPAAWGYSHPFAVLPMAGWGYPFGRPEVAGVELDAAGELCTPRDVLCRGQRVDRVRVGDILVFGNAGAYGWDISHHDFLRHPYPQMIVV